MLLDYFKPTGDCGLYSEFMEEDLISNFSRP